MPKSETTDAIGRAYGQWIDNQKIVRATYPSARVERKGLTFVAIMARTRNAEGILRDNFIGCGKTDAQAWHDAASEVSETKP